MEQRAMFDKLIDTFWRLEPALQAVSIVAALAVAYAFYLFFFRRTDW